MKTALIHLRYAFHAILCQLLYGLSNWAGEAASNQWRKAERANIDEVNARRTSKEVAQ